MISCIGVVFFLLFSSSYVRGENAFERALPRLNCFKPRQITGCNGKLIEKYANVSRSASDSSAADTYFYLFTRGNRANPENLQNCGGKIPTNSKFNRAHGTQFVVHGFLDGTCLSTWMREIKDQLLARRDYNVILVDWTWGNAVDYYDAVANMNIVAEQISIVIRNIMRQTGVKSDNFHMVGHSLGAQISGYVGQRVKIRRITALDPSLPTFYGRPLHHRLDRSDAEIVDAIHSNGGVCMPQFGYQDPVGDVDFYPNGGTVQLSCIPYMVISFLKGDFRYAMESILPDFCFHNQAIQYYKMSINPSDCEFIGVQCENYADFKSGKCRSCGADGSNCAVMGLDFEMYYKKDDSKTNKTYYLDTSMNCPYCDNSKVDHGNFFKPTADKTKQKSNSLPFIGKFI